MSVGKSLLPIALFLAGCAAYSGAGLKPGEARLDDVVATMGQPAMRWQDPDGSVQLAYPHAPEGTQTFMVYLGPDGRLLRVEKALTSESFAKIRRDLTKEQVQRILGPSYAPWTDYFKARDELVWEWRYCNDWNAATRFEVLFDGTKGTVRSTGNRTELCGKAYCVCSK